MVNIMFKPRPFSRWSVLFLVLIAFVAAWSTFSGIATVRYHGDEGTYLNDSVWYEQWISRDFTSLRKMNDRVLLEAPLGSLISGFSRQLAGLALPAGGYRWDFNLPWDQALPKATTPSASMLVAGRLPMDLLTFATIMLLASVLLNQVGFVASACVTLLITANLSVMEPLRKVMTESPLLFFSILGCVLCARSVMQLAVDTRRPRVLLLFCLAGMAVGLSTASKHNGVTALGAFFVTIPLALIVAKSATPALSYFRRFRSVSLQTIFYSTVSGIAVAGVFFTLNPFLWSDPIQAVNAIINKRNQLSTIQQHTFSSQALLELSDRIPAGVKHLFTQDSSFGCDPRDDGRVVMDTVTKTFQWVQPTTQAALSNSFLCAQSTFWSVNIRPITLLNITLCIIGIASLLYTQLRMWKARSFISPATTLLIWSIAVNLPIVLLSPLDWGRYYVLPVFFTTIWIAIGLAQAITWIGKVLRQSLSMLKPSSAPALPRII